MTLLFHTSDIILLENSDAIYLVNSTVTSHIVSYFKLPNQDFLISSTLWNNGPTLIECKTLQYIMASSTESKTVSTFHSSATNIVLIQQQNIKNIPSHKNVPSRGICVLLAQRSSQKQISLFLLG